MDDFTRYLLGYDPEEIEPTPVAGPITPVEESSVLGNVTGGVQYLGETLDKPAKVGEPFDPLQNFRGSPLDPNAGALHGQPMTEKEMRRILQLTPRSSYSQAM